MLGSPAGPGGPSQRGLWPLAPAPAPSATSFATDGLSKYGVYSLFPGGPTFGSALYSHASTIGRFASGHIQQSSGNTFHAAHKVSDSLFTSGYTFGAPTPPPGSPYSPIPVAQLELLAKGFSNSNIIIQQPDFPMSPKKVQITEKRCDEKCCNIQRTQKSCHCPLSPVKKIQELATGCSRTNPIEWSGVNVKKEPGSNPCQVAEITTSVSPVVKVEVTSPTQKNGGEAIIGNSMINGNDNAGSMAANISGAGQGGGALLQCTDDRQTGLAAWQVGGNHNQTLATPTLWQYPAPVPVEPMVPLPVPTMPPVGFQLVRDPTTGGLLLLPTTTGIEPLQQTVVWPSYPQPSSVILPSLSSMPPPPLQLLSSASSDYLSSSTTLHQHTQTHSTRLVAVTTDAKRKIPIPIPATTLIKIETDGSLDQTKTLQAVSTIASNTGTVFTDQGVPPLVTTHVIYQHPTNLIMSQPNPTIESACRSQATSPVVTSCLTPPPDIVHIHEEELHNTSTVQDASNQTDTPIYSEDDNTIQTISDVISEERPKEPEEIRPDDEEVMEVDVVRDSAPEIFKEVQLVDLEDMEEVSTSATLPEENIYEDKNKENRPEEPQHVPDLSGLELLSNSIVEFETCRNSSDDQVEPSPQKAISENTVDSTKILNKEICSKEELSQSVLIKVDDSLGGLDLLCALAEQRILEEKIEEPIKEKSKDKYRERERRREKRKSKKHYSDEPRRKRMKSDKRHLSNERDRDREQRKKEKRQASEKSDSDRGDKEQCLCKYKSYKTPESEQEVRKFLASKSQPNYCCKGEWPCMNAMELDMRMKLAELQRQYKEKQKELSKLKPKKHSHHSECSKKKLRKKSIHSERSCTPPPELDKIDVPMKPVRESGELLRPPKFSAIPKLDHQSDGDSSPEKYSSSKKRKVGRPKRLMPTGEVVGTETIFAKKPKNNFVGYLLAAKEKLKLQNREYPDSTPPRYIEETYTHKLKKVKNHNNNNTILMDCIKSSNIRPKLKAEATVKVYNDEEQNDWESVEEEEAIDHIEEDINEDIEENISTEESAIDQGDATVEEIVVSDNKINKKSNTDTRESKTKITMDEVKVEKHSPGRDEVPNPCALTDAHLDVDKLRVLTAMGGLFYAGRLNAVEPPDVYSITLDGERGNRPHIMSREEILRDAIVEVSPKTTDELPVGTRLCAYWSQQYRCLYPGSAAEPGTPDPQLDGKFVSVEFDDGDSGRIALQDIRLLPPNYPIMEYDPNPLLSLCKRRRRTSTSISTEEKHLPEPLKPIQETTSANNTPSPVQTKSILDLHKEKKRLKKKKRDKLKQKLLGNEDRKKKRKHKCLDEHCRHKKHHKKHRKHRKHHDKSRTESENSSKLEDSSNVDENLPEEMNVTVETDMDVEDETKVLNEVQDDESSKQSSLDTFPEYHVVANPEDEVTMDDIIEATQNKDTKKIRDRQESCESRSKMSAFLPARQLWHWSGKGYKRPRAKGKSKKCFYKSIQRGKEAITVGDSAVFLSTGRPDRPYIGRIEAMWEICGTMIVKVKWFYHPEETVGCPMNLQYPGALFESPHIDENDVQTISHKCEVLPLEEYTERLGDDPLRYASIYDNNDIYYLAGHYDPTSTILKMEPGIPFTKSD